LFVEHVDGLMGRNSVDGRGGFRERRVESVRQRRVETLETGRAQKAKCRHRLVRQFGDIEKL
jgi:hypothetical protein